MRSRVVPMRDMKEKFGTEVQSFRYAFVLPNHGSEWDGTRSLDPEVARIALARARAASPAAQATLRTQPPQAPATPQPVDAHPDAFAAPRRRATDKQPTFIEVKPRI